MACPAQITLKSGASATGTQANPLARGAAVVITPQLGDPGNFGTATSGTVTFQATIGGQQVTMPVPSGSVIWTAAAVTVQSVPNLPDDGSGQPQTWQLSLQAAGASSACGPYPVVVAAVSPGLSCPLTVTVADGVYGSAAEPAKRGQPITISAVSGFFGGSAAQAGTVTLTLPALGLTAAGTNVIWTPQAVTFTVPADLPATSVPAVWQAALEPQGATAACGPYSLVVEQAAAGAPPTVQVATIPNLPGRTDPRDQPVTLFALAGFFGNATATSGTVVLQRSSDQVQVPSDKVVWTPVAVSFIVPDLPDTQSVAEWQATLTPAGGQALGPYQLEVDVAEPLLVAVPPLAVSEQRIDVVAIGLHGLEDRADPTISLLVKDTGGNKLYGGNFPPPPRGEPSAIGVTVTTPTVTALRKSPTCGPNQLLIQVHVQLEVRQPATKPGDQDYVRTTNAMPMTLLMPPPSAGRIAHAGGVLKIGLPSGTPGTTGSYRSCEWVGPQSTGEVQLIAAPSPQLDTTELLTSLGDAQDTLAGELPQDPSQLTGSLSPFPDTATTGALSQIRNAGSQQGAQKLNVRDWGEEYIEVDLPESVTEGTLVLWRDDLPSAPITLLELPQVPCDASTVTGLVNGLFHVEGLPGAGSTLGLGQTLNLRVVRDQNAHNDLAQLLDAPNSPVQVAFNVTLTPTDPTSGGPMVALNGSATTDTVFGLPQDIAQPFLLRPEPQALDGTTQSTGWTLTVKATVTGLPLCSQPLTVDLVGSLAFRQVKLPVPELVIGFAGRNYQEAEGWSSLTAIAMITTGTPGMGNVLVDNDTPGTTAAVNTARSTLFGLLSGLRTALALIAPFAGISGSPWPGSSLFDAGTPASVDSSFETVIQSIANADTDDLTFDGTGSRQNLQDGMDPDWNGDIWSAFMFGPPDGSTLQLFGDENFGGDVLHLRMPSGNIMGGVKTFWSMWNDICQIGDLGDQGQHFEVNSYRWS
ncbi:MAG: hypothetical protein ACJ768_12630 [Gaiellaceae bacterium]